ncbi:MAG: hypothetical protein FWD59_01325 [Micrococcales bacterium]|nr:hypothetical protein [Micrococcales bacterium]
MRAGIAAGALIGVPASVAITRVPVVQAFWNDWIYDFLRGCAEAVLRGAFGQIEAAFSADLSTVAVHEWNVGTAYMGKVGWAMVFVAIALAVWELICAAVARNTERAGRAAIMLVLAWPVTTASVWLTIKTTAAIDQLTIGALSGEMSSNRLAADMADKLLFPSLGAERQGGSVVIDSQVVGGELLLILVFALLLWLCSLVLTLVMAFRAFALVVLVAGAPIALMSQAGGRRFEPMRRKWIQMVAALALAKFIAALLVMVSLGLGEASLNNSTGSTGKNLAGLAVGLVGLCTACLSPKLSSMFVAFASAELTAAAAPGQGMARGATRTAVHYAQMKMLRGGGGKTRAASQASGTAATSPSTRTPAPLAPTGVGPASSGGPQGGRPTGRGANKGGGLGTIGGRSPHPPTNATPTTAPTDDDATTDALTPHRASHASNHPPGGGANPSRASGVGVRLAPGGGPTGGSSTTGSARRSATGSGGGSATGSATGSGGGSATGSATGSGGSGRSGGEAGFGGVGSAGGLPPVGGDQATQPALPGMGGESSHGARSSQGRGSPSSSDQQVGAGATSVARPTGMRKSQARPAAGSKPAAGHGATSGVADPTGAVDEYPKARRKGRGRSEMPGGDDETIGWRP